MHGLSTKWCTAAVGLTLLYWYWETKASGNIRIDLVLIYPLLFATYTAALWTRFRFISLPIAGLLLLINVLVFVLSYPVADKYPG